MNPIVIVAVAIIVLVAGFVAGFFIRKYVAEARIGSAEEKAKRVLAEAKNEVEAKKKEAVLEAKDELHVLRTETEKEFRERRSELDRLDKRLAQREESLSGKNEEIEKIKSEISAKEQKLARRLEKLEQIYAEEKVELEKLAGMSAGQARELLMKRMEEEAKHDAAKTIKDIENKAREEADKRSRNIVSIAIQRCSTEHVTETTVSVVSLPSDEMKGRIIGREGRNIRAFEVLTGINLIIDDTPEAVILSGFDPVRREIARLSLEKLISDGRIQPARIEEMFNKSKNEVNSQIREAGEQATFDTDVQGLHAELVRALGRLKFRTSYGQNVLQHSLEVSHLAGVMAAEIGADIKLVKRAGLLHDIGKAIDKEVEGPHAIIGTELAKRFRESRDICHAIEAHHGDVEPHTVEAVLIQSADALSAARPGARRETLESYVKRLEKLESVTDDYDGVEKTYAIQAGREVRVMVKPEEINDERAEILAKDIAKRIEENLEYPGQIKVTVVREHRAIEYAK